MRLAAIDLGSNTVKMTVADISLPFDTDILLERVEVTRIGEGLDRRGALLPAAIERTLAVLADLANAARQLGAEKIGCVGTAGLRGASNAGDFLRRAADETGITVEVIDGAREAALAYRAPAAIFAQATTPIVVIDVGGRSTEIIVGRGPVATASASLEIGGVRLTERFLPSDPPTLAERQALEAHVRSVLEDAPSAPSDATVVGVSGTVLSLLGLHLGLDDMAETVRRAEQSWLPRHAVAGALEDLAARPATERRFGTVIPEGRADVIVAGTTVLLAALDRLRADRLRVTHRGVRFGLLAEMAQADKLGE